MSKILAYIPDWTVFIQASFVFMIPYLLTKASRLVQKNIKEEQR